MASTYDRLCDMLKKPVSESTQLWYMARNWLFKLGPQNDRFDFQRGINLAEKSSHPDAVWLVKLFYKNGKNCHKGRLSSHENLTFVQWLSRESSDPRALIYSWLLTRALDRIDSKGYFKRAFEMRNRLALAMTAEPDLRIAYESALQDEPFGWCLLAKLTAKKNVEFSFACLERAANMNNTEAQLKLTTQLDLIDPRAWYWAGRAAIQGDVDSRTWMFNLVCRFVWWYDNPNTIYRSSRSGEIFNPTGTLDSGKALFALGKIMKCVVLNEHGYPSRASPVEDTENIIEMDAAAYESIRMYYSWCNLTKEAINTWCMVAIRLTRIPRDVRKIVSRFIWESRSKALYHINTGERLVEQSTIPTNNKKQKYQLDDSLEN